MCRKLTSWVVVLAFCLTGVTQAETILLVSDCYVPGVEPTGNHEDDWLVTFLQGLGYTVDTDGMRQNSSMAGSNYREGGTGPWAAGNESKLAHLRDADLVVVSRRTDSGSFDADRANWNALETPLLLISGYLTRGGGDNRWNWTPGGSGDASLTTTDIVIVAGQEGHPFLAGLSGPIKVFDWSTAPTPGTCPKGVYLPNDPFVSGTILIGTFGGRPMVADIPKGTTFANGNVAGERRAFLGHWGYDLDGPYGFESFITENHKTLLTNMINEMAGVIDLGAARNPDPRDGATDVQPTVTLSWTAGEKTASHNIYLGESLDDVNDATVAIGSQTQTTYAPSSLQLSKTYFWRIDEVHTDATITKGKVWSFTVADYLRVDDFEDYNDDTNLIYLTWIDGYGSPAQGIPGNGTGSTVGNTDAPYAERIIFHSGSQSMPLAYDNSVPAKLSEAVAKIDDLKSGRDWTRLGLKALSLWFRGYPAYVGGFVEGPAGTYTVTGGGADIWGNADQFHFAFKELSGAGTIIAKVQSLSDTNEWSKAGVMIRDSLDANSANAAVLITPAHGVRFQYRNGTAGVTDRLFADGITAPQWVKIERTIGGLVKGSYSADGITWVQFDLLDKVVMNMPVYIGLAVTSHDVDAACVAQFSDVSFPGTTVGPQWSHQDIGIVSNDAEPMYVSISNSNGQPAVVSHQDPNATLISTWTPWNISLKEFSDQGVNLADVDKIVIGFGDKRNPRPGGAGKMYFDDIRLYPPRCLPGLLKPAGDLTNDCKVDYLDVELVANNWLVNEYDVTPTVPSDSNLVARYQFENNANDSIGGRHGQVNGDPTYAAGVVGNWAIDLDGTEDYVQCPNDAAFEITAQITVAAWIKVAAFDTTWQAIVTKGDDSWRLHRWSSNNSLSWNCNGVTGGTLRAHSTDIGIDDGRWHHVAGVYDGSKMYLYVDGMLDNSQDASGAINVGAYPVMIGENAQQVGREWNGLIDDVRIYSRALAHAEIASLAGKTQKLTQPLDTLLSPRDPALDMYGDGVIDLKDFARLADSWLEYLLWPQP